MMDEALRRVAGTVESRLKSFFDDVSKEPVPGVFSTRADSILLEQVRDLTMRGGKRLRAALVVHGALLFDDRAEELTALWDTAAAMELLHTYFLIHDDIMDGDEMRRGGPSVHAALSQKTGSSELGVGLGILAGDLSSALSQMLISSLDLDRERLARVNGLFAKMHLDVVCGQTLDMFKSATAAEVAAHKTASYTTMGPLAMGAAVAGASDSRIEALAKSALPLGEAFQFSDDLLGTFGQREVTGKPVGTDLKKGKQTILLERGLSMAKGADLKAIETAAGNREATDQEIDAARDALVACGAQESCKQTISDLVGVFIDDLEQGDYLDSGRDFLIQAARFIETRKE